MRSQTAIGAIVEYTADMPTEILATELAEKKPLFVSMVVANKNGFR